jgi:alpha-tubulin suppressor-like RCC1 family protein
LDATKTCLIGFGDNKFGQLDIVDGDKVNNDSSRTATIFEPKLFPVGRSVKGVGCGWTHLLLLSSDDKLWSSGRNNYGQLGRLFDLPCFIAVLSCLKAVDLTLINIRIIRDFQLYSVSTAMDKLKLFGQKNCA